MNSGVLFLFSQNANGSLTCNSKLNLSGISCGCNALCSASTYKIYALISVPNTPYIASAEYSSNYSIRIWDLTTKTLI